MRDAVDVLRLAPLPLALLLGALLPATGCQDVGITQQPDREGDDPGECEDNADNDGDGRFDCEDEDCAGAPACLPNQPPTRPEIRIDPFVPTTTDGLGCVIDAPSLDEDGDEITYTYRWEVDGEEAGDSPNIAAAETTKNEVWTCFVTPSDGLQNGSTATASVTIENTAPGAPTVTINPGTPTVDNDLICQIGQPSVDADGDAVTYTYAWQRDGTSTGRTDSVVPAASTENGQTWRCVVTPHDDEEEGATGADEVEIHFDVVPHVTTGRWHTCSIGFDGSYDCFGVTGGGNNHGQVTDQPAEAFGVISVGENHSCGMTLQGVIRCWGLDDRNQGSDPFGTFTTFDSGYDHGCGITNQQVISCWGSANNWPTAPPAGVYEFVASGDEFACGLRPTGAVDCWNGVTSPVGAFLQVDAGGGHACAVSTGGTIECWGSDSDGQVSGAPSGNTWSHVSAGDRHSCAVSSVDGSVTCWGASGNDRLAAPGGSFSMVDAGWNHTCGMRDNGQVTCWGCAGADEGQCSP